MAPGNKDAVRSAFNDIHVGVDFWEPIDYSLIKVCLTPDTSSFAFAGPCAEVECSFLHSTSRRARGAARRPPLWNFGASAFALVSCKQCLAPLCIPNCHGIIVVGDPTSIWGLRCALRAGRLSSQDVGRCMMLFLFITIGTVCNGCKISDTGLSTAAYGPDGALSVA